MSRGNSLLVSGILQNKYLKKTTGTLTKQTNLGSRHRAVDSDLHAPEFIFPPGSVGMVFTGKQSFLLTEFHMPVGKNCCRNPIVATDGGQLQQTLHRAV